MPLASQRTTTELQAEGQPEDPVRAGLAAYHQAGVAAVDKWHHAYVSRNPGDMRMTPGNFGVAVATEARRLRDGQLPVKRTAPEIELAATETEKIRSSLVGFLQDWGILARPGSSPTPAAGSIDRAALPHDSPIPVATQPPARATILRDSPMPIAPQPAATVGTPAAGTPTGIYELLKATLHGAALKDALDVLRVRVRDSSIALPSRQEIEAVWKQYLGASSPARDEKLKAYLHRWGLMSGQAPPAPAHDVTAAQR